MTTALLDLKQLIRMGPTNVYGQTLYECMQNNPHIMTICADMIDASGLHQASLSMPERCINAGIAEQNMVGLAAGLASVCDATGEPNNVFISTYTSFCVERTFELLKIQIASMKLNVKVVGLFPGFANGFLGNSHYCLSDLALTRLLPNFIVLSSADVLEARAMVQFLSTYQGPAYLRLNGVPGMPLVHDENFTFTFGKAECLIDGEQLAILATGAMVNEALRAARRLQKRGINAAVYNFSTIKPLDEAALTEILGRFEHVITIEEHYKESGLGNAVMSFMNQLVLSGGKVKPKGINIIGVDTVFSHPGSYPGLLRNHNLNAQNIIQTAEALVQA